MTDFRWGFELQKFCPRVREFDQQFIIIIHRGKEKAVLLSTKKKS